MRESEAEDEWMSAAAGQSGAIVSSVPTLLISAGYIEPQAAEVQEGDHTDIKSFSHLFQKSLIKV